MTLVAVGPVEFKSVSSLVGPDEQRRSFCRVSEVSEPTPFEGETRGQEKRRGAPPIGADWSVLERVEPDGVAGRIDIPSGYVASAPAGKRREKGRIEGK